MDLRKLKTLIDLVSESGISELEVNEGEDRVRIVNSGSPVAAGQVVYANPAPVQAVAPAPVAAAAGSSASAQCPQGWKLNKASVNKKTGAYTCTAKPGTPLPASNAACPGDLSYFENAKKGQLGCRP